MVTDLRKEVYQPNLLVERLVNASQLDGMVCLHLCRHELGSFLL
jgi:hypothetical protein